MRSVWRSMPSSFSAARIPALSTPMASACVPGLCRARPPWIRSSRPSSVCRPLGHAPGHGSNLDSACGCRKDEVPCMIVDDFKLRDGRLHLSVFFRSHDFAGAYPANLYGLARCCNMSPARWEPCRAASPPPAPQRISTSMTGTGWRRCSPAGDPRRCDLPAMNGWRKRHRPRSCTGMAPQRISAFIDFSLRLWSIAY